VSNRCWVFNESQRDESLIDFRAELKAKGLAPDQIDSMCVAAFKYLNSDTLKSRKMVMLPGSTFHSKEVDDEDAGAST
jgi:hypothetical protein